MHIKDKLRKIWYGLFHPGRVVLLEYPVQPTRTYTEDGHPHEALFQLINENREHYRRLLENTLAYTAVFAAIQQDALIQNDTEPGWNNGHLPGLDIIMLYSMVAQLKPARYVEVGSGTSTRVAYKAKKENGLSTAITAIDPAPRKKISHLADIFLQQNIRDAGMAPFSNLGENDIVFFDGSHMLLPGSDVMWFFLEILPRLKKGVVVHIHDVYLPYDYPDFMCARHYSEQYLLGALLAANNDKYEILCPCYFMYMDKELSNILSPVWQLPALQSVEKHGGSFWMRIKS